MKKKGINLESSIEKLESEVRLYHDLDAVIKSYREDGELTEKDIVSVIERVKFQMILDEINRQKGMKEKLDNFTRKWNLFKKDNKEPRPLKSVDRDNEETIQKTPTAEEHTALSGDIDADQKEKAGAESFIKRLKRKLKLSRCGNCGYFLVHDADKHIYQCTFFEFSSQVDKKDVCENWINNKKVKKSFI